MPRYVSNVQWLGYKVVRQIMNSIFARDHLLNMKSVSRAKNLSLGCSEHIDSKDSDLHRIRVT